MDEEIWSALNERLARLSDVAANYIQRVSEERQKIESAARTVSDKLIGHYVKVDVQYDRAVLDSIRDIELSLVREDDDYAFRAPLRIMLHEDGRIFWKNPLNPDGDVERSLLTKMSELGWQQIIISMIAQNLELQAA